jgi:hypothetical protein
MCSNIHRDKIYGKCCMRSAVVKVMKGLNFITIRATVYCKQQMVNMTA